MTSSSRDLIVSPLTSVLWPRAALLLTLPVALQAPVDPRRMAETQTRAAPPTLEVRRGLAAPPEKVETPALAGPRPLADPPPLVAPLAAVASLQVAAHLEAVAPAEAGTQAPEGLPALRESPAEMVALEMAVPLTAAVSRWTAEHQPSIARPPCRPAETPSPGPISTAPPAA